MKKINVMLAVGALFIIAARGQGFVNLDFESAYNLPSNPPFPDGSDVSVTNALPGWKAYDGPGSYSDIYYVSNRSSGYTTVVELEGGSLALSGDFSVGIYQGGSISQTAAVPDNAESLDFEAYVLGQIGLGASDLTVTLGGQNLSILPEGGEVYGVNIPADLDGLTETLAFSCQGVGSGNLLLDNIEFSSSVVPEPPACTLVCLGVMVFGYCGRKRGVRPQRAQRPQNSSMQ